MNKKKRIKSKNKPVFFIIVLIVILIAVLIYTLREERELNTFESLIRDSATSVQKVFNVPFKGIGSIFSDFIHLKDVLEENKILKSNIEKIESIEAENTSLKRELEEMKNELNIEHVLSDYDYLNATVISRNYLYWYNLLTIDKGSHNGIEEGMVVMNSTGLIGKIVNVSTFSSDVKLITAGDTNNKISVSILHGDNKVIGLVNGYDFDEGFLKVEGISNTKEIEVGDKVYTSGLGGVFPSGILIGEVEAITTDVYDLAKIINVKLSANFDDINYVTILKRTDTK